MSVAEKIRDMISEGQLEEPLQEAINYLRGRDAGLFNECIQHQGRLNERNREFRLHMISAETMALTRAQVRSALIDVVAKQLDADQQAPPAFVPPTQPQQQTVVLNFVPNAPNQHQPDVPSGAAASIDHSAAQRLVQDFLQLLATYEVENAAWRAAPFLHRSLLNGEMLQPQFKQNNFYAAHQRFRMYKTPIHFTKTQSTNRTAIGPLRDRDEGEEFVYTLEKMDDSGGMPGTVRVFFPKEGSAPKITLVSL